MQDAKDQIIHETKVLLNRWDAECDLDEIGVAKAVMLGINDWLERQVVEFEFEIEFEDEEEEDEHI
jgi:hypothetical protein